MRAIVWAVALVSAALLGFEISVMRLLLVASFHHFAFLVISVVLLGFGASGTALVVLRARALRHGSAVLFALILGCAISMPLGWTLAQHVPVEARVVPGLLGRQIGAWVVFWAVLTVPFFLGASGVGLALMMAPDRTGTVYGANLLGSAGGALAAPLVMSVVEPSWLPAIMGAVGLSGASVLLLATEPISMRRVLALAGCGLAVAGWLWLDRPRVRVDPYKYVARLHHLSRQGSVERVGRVFGPRAAVEAYRGGVLHDLPFLAVGGEAPPEIGVLVADGHLAGSVLDVADLEGASVVDHTLMAFPYALLPPHPGVTLLGEAGGMNIWLAARHGAAFIDVVQGDRNVWALLRGPLADHGGDVLELWPVRTNLAEPRHFIERTSDRYDLIQLSLLESSAAGSSGMAGLGQDHLVTVDGLTACLEALTDQGMVTVSRGIQTPPRDNIKLAATFAAALRSRGVKHPATHVVIVRDYLAVCTIVKAAPWTPREIGRVRELCRQRDLTPVWFEGVEPHELNMPDVLPPAPDGVGDLYHFAARRILAQDRDTAEALIDDWPFDVRPPTDDRPFFADFCTLATMGRLRATYGELWLTRTELAFLFVLAATVIVALTGALATIVPLPWLGGEGGGRLATVTYFGCLGLGYLLLEMVYLSRLTFVIGDPIRAAALTISGFLFFSGLGSITSRRIASGNAAAVLRLVVALAVLGLGGALVLEPAAVTVGSLPGVARDLVVLGVIAPVAFLMGFPMPIGLARVGSDSGLVAWAWGINGFASVLAPPLALVVAMTWGYRASALASVILYMGAGLLFARLPGHARPQVV